MYSVRRMLPLGAALGFLALGGGAVQAQTATLDLHPLGVQAMNLPYVGVRLKLTDQKPAGITKEPVYTGKVQYGVFHLGNGPKSSYIVALDEPENGERKIYVDKNQNGDLTDDGDGAWSGHKKVNGYVLYGINPYLLRASWGTAEQETSSGKYGIGIFRSTKVPELLICRLATRVGKIEVDGKRHKAVLVESDADALFDKALDDSGQPLKGTAHTSPVWLMVDLNDNGRFAPPVDARSPFKLGAQVYVADIAPDGSSITLKPTTRTVSDINTFPTRQPHQKPAPTPVKL